MKQLDHLLDALNTAWRWLRTSRYAPGAAWGLGIVVMLMCQHAGYHESFMPQLPEDIHDLPNGWSPPADGVYITLYLLAYTRLFVLVGGVIYHVYIIRAYPRVERMLLPTWIASVYLTLWALASNFYDKWEEGRIGVIGEETSMTAFVIQLILMVALLVSPPFLLRYYLHCRIMERYVMRNFLQPLVFCFVAFCTLWIVMDLLDHLHDFRSNKISGWDIVMFYIKLLPFIYVTVSPVTLLLATLYSLGKMSRANEIISMLGVGRSMGQVLRPIFLAGAYASFLGTVANYHWAPTSAGNKEKLLEDVKEHVRQDILTMGLVYRNNEDRRTWFVGVVPADLHGDKLRRIEVRQEDERGNITKSWFARSANWWPQDRTWTFYGGAEVAYENGGIVGMKQFDFNGKGYSRYDAKGWTETPWILMSGSLQPDYLGVPQLISYINSNRAYDARKLAPFVTHLFYRFAQPWQTFIVIIVAAPLGVVFSRRGLLGGVASSIFVFFFLLFIDHLFLNLGTGSHMPAFLSVWMPHVILGGVGCYVFHLRSQNRDLPKFSLKGLRDAAVWSWSALNGLIRKARF
jgi:lipopolysaccharide export system permease protein